jgi:predicted house-cleaning noncanonical NTP pyrophosphatase (MazG superfamily)
MKLVRDRVPEIIRATGAEPVVFTAAADQVAGLLRSKLEEEAAEAAEADSPDDLAGELADVLEVVHALADTLGLTPADLEELRLAKRADRGGFDERVVWVGNR